jgi:phosphoglycerate dehydrogenase-like enzyme
MRRLLLLATCLLSCHATPATAPLDEGSLRHARVAIPRPEDPAAREELTYFAEDLSEQQLREVAAVAPQLRVLTGLTRDEARLVAAQAHGADAYYATPEFLAAAHELAWVQAQSAGVDRLMGLERLHEGSIVLTNLRAVHGPAIADHAFAMLLALTRDLPVHLEGRAGGRWQRDGSGVLQPLALEGRTLLVVGLGGIGTEIARRGHGFGMTVLATRRSGAAAPAFVEHVGRPDELLALLPRADVVAIAAPLTDETRGLFGTEAFAAMKPGSFLVNVARGQIVDTDALLAALESGRLAGACLDVTDPEPLPADHPLWRLPNVVITPHVASDARLTDERAWEVFRENLRRFDAGEPLLNGVDPEAGY